MARMQLIKQDKWRLPEVSPFEYIVELLLDVGLTAGGEAITWQELEAWQRMTYTPLNLWEKKLLKKLSAVYLAAARRFNGSTEQSPIDALNRDKGAVASKLMHALSEIQRSREEIEAD